MIHVIRENRIIYNGFNFYPLSDDNSFGFKFRYGPRLIMSGLGSNLFQVRYSKMARTWFIRNIKIENLKEQELI